VRVLLIEPPGSFLTGQGPRQAAPLGLGYVGAELSRDHDVRTLLPDTRAHAGNDPWGRIAGAILGQAPDLIGITLVTAQLPATVRLVALIRRLMPGVPVVLGGPHPTADPAGALGETGADFAVVGEGEITARELARALEISSDKRQGYGHIAGLAWALPGGSVAFSGPRPPIGDLGSIAWPLRTGLVWPEDVLPSLYSAVLSARGCPYSCIYCAAGLMGRGVRNRPVDDVVSELIHLRRSHGVDQYFFHDSVFTAGRARTMELCARLAKQRLGVTWACQTRVNCLDPELLAALAQAGCRHIMLGIESGNPHTLRLLAKPGDPDLARTVVAQIKAAGIRATGFFMVGWPWDDAAQVQATADYACSLGLNAAFLFSVTPLPGTALWSYASQRQMPVAVDFREPVVNLTALPDSEYRELFARVKGRLEAYNIAQMAAQAQQGVGEEPAKYGATP